MIFRESTFVPEMDIVAAEALNKEVTVCSPNLVAVAQILIPRVFTMQNRVVLWPPTLVAIGADCFSSVRQNALPMRFHVAWTSRYSQETLGKQRANILRSAATLFATKRYGIGQDDAAQTALVSLQTLAIEGFAGTLRYGAVWLAPNFKTGALNRSAIPPS
ncbi:MAG: hypothetical protein E5V72_04360 [Mesorhizobium sp.]|nr:MAG: hypothetical protein E5V72_04360 [Mesorhizobium sp.]